MVRLFHDNPYIPASKLPNKIKRPLRVYISGPMTGYEGHNYATFDETAEVLRQLGYEVRSPSENFDGETGNGLQYDDFFRKDIANLLWVDFIVVLDEWFYSPGAVLECRIAKVLGLPILEYTTFLPISRYWQRLLDKAPLIVRSNQWE